MYMLYLITGGNLIVHLVIHLTLTYLSSFHFVIYDEMITRRSQKNLLQNKQIFFRGNSIYMNSVHA